MQYKKILYGLSISLRQTEMESLVSDEGLSGTCLYALSIMENYNQAAQSERPGTYNICMTWNMEFF